jgi:hypothetical protein
MSLVTSSPTGFLKRLFFRCLRFNSLPARVHLWSAPTCWRFESGEVSSRIRWPKILQFSAIFTAQKCDGIFLPLVDIVP